MDDFLIGNVFRFCDKINHNTYAISMQFKYFWQDVFKFLYPQNSEIHL